MPRRFTAALLTLAFLSLLLLGGCNGCGGPERTVLRGGTRHLPLLHGRVLRYQETVNGKTTPYTIRMVYAGGNLLRIYDLEWKGLERGFTSFSSDSSHVFFETEQPLTAVTNLLTYRELWVDETADEGANWDEENLGTNTVFAGYERVTVPAGTYDHCYKTVASVQPVYMDSLVAYHERGEMNDADYAELAKRANLVVIRWFAPGVGLVKEQIGDERHVRELVAVEKEGIGVDAPPPEPTTIESGE